jgi:hypothetical protein
MDWQTTLIDPVSTIITKIAAYVPNILGALIILLIGFVIGKVIEGIATKFLKLIQFDTAADKSGITNILNKGEIRKTPAELIGALVYWLIIFLILIMAINALNLDITSQLLNEVILYIPHVIAAVFVLVLGTFLSTVVFGIVLTTTKNAGLEYAEIIAKVSQASILIFTGVMALEQLGIATQVLVSTLNIFVAAVAFGFALAFGLGCKDIVAKYVENFLKK